MYVTRSATLPQGKHPAGCVPSPSPFAIRSRCHVRTPRLSPPRQGHRLPMEPVILGGGGPTRPRAPAALTHPRPSEPCDVGLGEMREESECRRFPPIPPNNFCLRSYYSTMHVLDFGGLSWRPFDPRPICVRVSLPLLRRIAYIPSLTALDPVSTVAYL